MYLKIFLNLIYQKIYLFELSKLLKKNKKKINSLDVKWIDNFNSLKKGPVIFFGNEFFDAIPIKQFKRYDKFIMEKYIGYENNLNIKEVFKKASNQDTKK